MANRRTVLDPADLRLREAEPASHNLLWYPVLAVVGQVVRVLPVRAGHLSDVLRCEGLPEPLCVPELGWYIRRFDTERRKPLLAGIAQVASAVTRKPRAATAIARPTTPVH